MSKPKELVPEIVGAKFKNKTVPLTGRRFRNCTFRNCILTIAGPPISLDSCSITSCELHAIGAAELLIAGGDEKALDALRQTVEGMDRLLLAPPGVDEHGNLTL